MKKIILLTNLALFVCVCDCLGVVLSLTGMSTEVPDNNPIGIALSADVSGPASVIESVSVTMETSGGYNGDLYAYLSFGSDIAILLNRPGVSSISPFGFSDSGFDVTFSDAFPLAPDPHIIGGSGGVVSGTFSSDARGVSPLGDPANFDSAPRTMTLSAFEGLNPNGTWTFFVADLSGGDTATLETVEIIIETTVPEPGTSCLIVGLSALASASVRRRGR